MPSRGNVGYSGLLPVTLVLSITGTPRLTWSASDGFQPLCKPGIEFWSTGKAGCQPCTICEPKFTLSPCAVHKDAICGPLSALEIDWSFLSARQPSEPSGRIRMNAHQSSMIWQFPRPQEYIDELQNTPFSEQPGKLPASGTDKVAIHDAKERLNNEANLTWDWQASVLILAICACVVFFFVAGCSAVLYARQWRHIKKNFKPAGLEEISAKLNLMLKAELAEFTTGAHISPGDPEIRYQYLEKLLDQRREAVTVVMSWPEVGSNLYIEEGETPSSRHT